MAASTSFAQSIFILMLIGFVAAIVLKLFKVALGCIILGVATIVVLAIVAYAMQLLS